MNNINGLIKKLSSNNIEYKSLGQLGKFYGGLTGKVKNDFVDGNAKFITYKNIYNNPALKIDVSDRVKVDIDEKQHSLQYGDVIFTGSSETPDECGISSVVTTKTDEKLYLNSFCFFFRFDDPNIILPDFSKHLFRSSDLRYQIGKTASGVTRYNVSKKLMEKVIIPLPPLEIQEKIVEILDKFTDCVTELTAELTAELTLRRKQYEYYRDELLVFNESLPFIALSKLCDIGDGLHGTPIYNDFGEYCFINGNNLSKGRVIFDAQTKRITQAEYEKIKIPFRNTLLFSINGTIGNIAIYNGEKIALGKSVAYFNVVSDRLLLKYLYYILQSAHTMTYFDNNLTGSTIRNLGLKTLRDYKIAIPPLAVQQRIVDILDKFDAYCNDLTQGLPAEIEARQKQYEYYRDKLLTFKPLED